MLRNQLADKPANFPDPILGINLRAADEDLRPGEARFMRNMEFIDGLRTRLGSVPLTPSSLGSYRISGGHKFYYGTGQSARLVAYGPKIVLLSDLGAETELSAAMTENTDVHFETWKTTDKVYVANGVDKLYEYDGLAWQSVDSLVGAQNVPNGCKMVKPVLDRLMALTLDGFIERSNPRVAHKWSADSSWATFRPMMGGPFTAIHPHTLRSTQGDVYPGLIATQANALYMITGTNFGADVTAGTASTGEDGAIKLIDPRIGTSSPYSICTVPGVGVFGVSSDLNVWWLPFGEASPRIIGDKIRANPTTGGGSTPGLETGNIAQLSQIWMVYFDRRLILGFPTGSDTHCSTYFYLDMKSFMEHPDRGPVWSGPHTGFTVNRCWVESQFSENALIGGEGNPATGAYVYRMAQDVAYDMVGAEQIELSGDYKTFWHHFNAPTREKYMPGVEFYGQYDSPPTISLHDLDSTIATGLEPV
jgi:hypothetical protein